MKFCGSGRDNSVCGLFSRRLVQQRHFDALRHHFSERQIVQIVALISVFGFLNRWNDTMATALEGHPTDFAEAVCALLSDESRRTELGANGREYVCERFRWETISLGMDDVYAAAAAGSD